MGCAYGHVRLSAEREIQLLDGLARYKVSASDHYETVYISQISTLKLKFNGCGAAWVRPTRANDSLKLDQGLSHRFGRRVVKLNSDLFEPARPGEGAILHYMFIPCWYL